MMKEYKYTKEERTVNGKKYNVIIPDKHSTIDALIFETEDLNAWDSYANITRYRTICLTLRKGEKEWETLYDGPTRLFKLNGDYIGIYGIFNLLFQLESEKVRERITKREKIKELKDRISRDSKRLKELGGK